MNNARLKTLITVDELVRLLDARKAAGRGAGRQEPKHAARTAELGSCLTDATREGRSRRAVRDTAMLTERMRQQFSRLLDPVGSCKASLSIRASSVCGLLLSRSNEW